jgi:hypothetical protein
MWSSLLPSQTYQECDNLVVPVGDSQEFRPSSDHRSSAILGLSRDLVFGRTKLATLMNVVSLLMHEIFRMIFYPTVGWIEFLLEI